MGRRAKPAEVKVAQGNPGKRRVRLAPLDVAKPLGDAVLPALTSPAAREVWKDLAPQLRSLNFLRDTDTQPFLRYCVNVARYWEITTKLAVATEVYETESKHGKLLRINPLFLVQQRLEKSLLDLEDRFGLNPAARQSIMLRLSSLAPQLPGLGPEPSKQQEAPGDPAPPPGASPVGLLN